MQCEVTNHALESYELISWKMQTCLIIFWKIISSKTSCIQTENKWLEGNFMLLLWISILFQALVSLGKLKPARIPGDFQPVTSRSTDNNGWSSTFCIYAKLVTHSRAEQSRVDWLARRHTQTWSQVHTKLCNSVSTLVCMCMCVSASVKLHKRAHTHQRGDTDIWHLGTQDNLAPQ